MSTQSSATDSLGICETFCSKAGCRAPDCGSLHICKFYVLGNCFFREKCFFGHDLRIPRNLRLLTNHNLDKLQEEQIKFQLLTQNRSRSFLPPICKFYNVEPGCRHGEEGVNCANMHVCKHFIQDSCAFGFNCKRSHNILDAQPKALLQKYGIDVSRSQEDVLQDLKKAYGGIHDSTLATHSVVHKTGFAPTNEESKQDAHVPDPDMEEICIYALRKQCNYGSNCSKHHVPHPYQWQFKLAGSPSWESISTEYNAEIEQTFSEPKNRKYAALGALADGRYVDININFETMKGTVDGVECNMRRLSTLSYVKAVGTHRFTTKWQWYWRDDDKIWKKYGQEGPKLSDGIISRMLALGMGGSLKSDITSQDIEKEYVQFDNAAPTEISFCTAANKYVLDLKEMKQKNIKYGTERKVRRRPAFVPLNHGEDLRDDRSEASSIGGKSVVSAISMIEMPSNWTCKAAKDNEMDILEITSAGSTLAEYFKIESLFHETMSRTKYSITRVRRVQNPELWEKYQRNKVWREKKTGVEQDERLMFHGTSTKYVDAICQQGFDWRLAGTSFAAAYGKGSYFAFRASLAGEYSRAQGEKCVFVVRVLIGNPGLGKASYAKPPPLDPDEPLGQLYDTCVDRIHNPRMVVTFEMERSYPEYVIEYTNVKSS